MSAKCMHVIAAAIFLSGTGALLCQVTPSTILAAGAQTRPSPVQAAQPRQNPPAQARDRGAAANPYRPASAVSAADVQFPFQTAADGIVAFDVALGVAGEIRNIAVLEDVPPFTAAAEQSLRSWKFATATQNGRPENSEVVVAFVFRHSVYIANEPPFTPIPPTKQTAETRGFTPPGILSVSYAAYPANTIAMGAVVVQVTVKTDGSAGGVSIVRDLPGDFGALAVKAAKHWKFQPAKRDGQPVTSKVPIAFVFSSRALNPF